MAKDKQQNAQTECTKLERDMNEFKNNKEGKTEELKVGCTLSGTFLLTYRLSQREIAKKKTALQKHAVIVKTQQKEHQTATLELGISSAIPP